MPILPARRGEESFAEQRGSFLFASRLAIALMFGAGCSLPAEVTVLPPPSPPLPPPSGTVVSASTVAQLQNAVSALASNTTILIAPGTDNVTQALRIRGDISNVALRDVSGYFQ